MDTVGKGRKPTARYQFLGYTGTANAMAALYDQNIQTSFGQVATAHQAVVSGANHDYIGSDGHGCDSPVLIDHISRHWRHPVNTSHID